MPPVVRVKLGPSDVKALGGREGGERRRNVDGVPVLAACARLSADTIEDCGLITAALLSILLSLMHIIMISCMHMYE